MVEVNVETLLEIIHDKALMNEFKILEKEFE